MLDVLVTISDSTPPAFVSECLNSVRVAAELAPYPVRIIETPGVPGHIGRAMLNGLRKCTADWVAWVDDDDFALPNAFSCLQRHFPAWPSAICAREIRLHANGRWIAHRARHHLTAFRRDIIESVDLTQYPSLPNVALHRAAEADAVDELSWVYLHRKRLSPGMALRASATADERRILQ